jgi:hypothetical protein
VPTMTFSSNRHSPIISANGHDFACVIPDWGVLSLPSYSARAKLDIRRRHHYDCWAISTPDYAILQESSIALTLEIESHTGVFSEAVPADLRRRLLAADELTILELLKIVHEKAGQGT